MRNLTIFFAFFILLSTQLIAQTPPNAFNYSAVARNAAGQPIATTTISIQITILKSSPTGASQYSENHFVNTDAFGLFNLVIGAGAMQSGSMATIDWSNDNYYLKVGMDANGGTNFLTMGTTQLLSVPYALYAKSAENGIERISTNGDTLYLSNGQIFVSGNNVNNGGSIIGTPIFTQGNGVSDIDGNQYQTIILGFQEWMASNLKTTRFSNGDLIPNITDSAQWSNLTNSAWCYYNNDNSINIPYGKLYNGYTVNDSRNVCPNGWHVPTLSDFNKLSKFIDNYSDTTNAINGGSISNFAGGTMKSTGILQFNSGLWLYPNEGAINTSGFLAVPAGWRTGGAFFNMGSQANFWTSSINNLYENYTIPLSDTQLVPSWNILQHGNSIRCIKN